MGLPNFQSDNRVLQMLQTRWASIIDPVISNPANNSLILKNVQLVSGTNIVNTLLGRKLQGWSIVRLRGAATIYDEQDTNSTPNLTLILVSNANVSCDLELF